MTAYTWGIARNKTTKKLEQIAKATTRCSLLVVNNKYFYRKISFCEEFITSSILVTCKAEFHGYDSFHNNPQLHIVACFILWAGPNNFFDTSLDSRVDPIDEASEVRFSGLLCIIRGSYRLLWVFPHSRCRQRFLVNRSTRVIFPICAMCDIKYFLMDMLILLYVFFSVEVMKLL